MVAELRRSNVRYLPLPQLFELASQAEASSIVSFFPRFQERIRQEFKPQNRYEQLTRNSGKHFPSRRDEWHQFRAATPTQNEAATIWPPTVRPQINNTRPTPTLNAREQTPAQKGKDYEAFLRTKPCWVCERTGHLIRECPKRKTTGCPKCGQKHSIFHCPQRKPTLKLLTVPQEDHQIEEITGT